MIHLVGTPNYQIFTIFLDRLTRDGFRPYDGNKIPSSSPQYTSSCHVHQLLPLCHIIWQQDNQRVSNKQLYSAKHQTRFLVLNFYTPTQSCLQNLLIQSVDTCLQDLPEPLGRCVSQVLVLVACELYIQFYLSLRMNTLYIPMYNSVSQKIFVIVNHLYSYVEN